MKLVPALVWFVAGTGLSIAHLAIMVRSVGRLGGASGVSAVGQTVSGYFARYLSLLVMLLLALRVNAIAGIVFAVGY